MSRRSRFGRSDIMAFLAVLISFAALIVSLLETRILREQQALMKSEQKAAVWPYLEQRLHYAYDSIAYIELAIVNKGVGPAKISNGHLIIDKSNISNYQSLGEKLRSLFPPETKFEYGYSSVDGVLSPEEKNIVLDLKFPRFKNDVGWIRNLSLGIEVCYCSIYNDCWTVKNLEEPTSESECKD